MVVMCVLVVMHCIIPLRTGGTGTMRQRNELPGQHVWTRSLRRVLQDERHFRARH
ncbi:hypothetical protein PF005_g2125 [Phytophthora fragariae]|uniref:RxLR effector protein n=1 Tax=Phytophthora fragariae TaxID=53985 RepID=A0A6A4ADQ3_9STRA|nr:hypothetical protein PF003_g5444 [Phytophthora fragariae]KAE8947984.1 hypothetical protein PF009_g2423 [Phytophthora fragariae]KAE9028505.1 hypothetical protein PF011_g1534 [Phytophthora fragariae]KAE9136304.1 hypothetical protein PF010_g1738 [Phytophthora fragariae]KAE9136434.1 hypothetical protein PF007_g2196 [Phytophthora fragariae]